MRKIAVFVLTSLLALAIAYGSAHATPSTLVWIPSTDIQASGATHFGYDVYAPSSGSALNVVGLTFGMGRFEYGADYLSQDGIEYPFRLNAKFMLKDETDGSPRLTIGTYDVGSGTASNMVYLLGSKTMGGIRATFGYCAGDSSLGDDDRMVMLGLDRSFGPKWWGAVDYQSGKSAFGALSIGASYNLTPARSIIVGYDWYNDSALSDTLTVQYDMNF